MAFRVSRRARVHAVTFAEIVAGSRSDRTNDHDYDHQEYPSPLRHFRYPRSAVAIFRHAEAARYLKRKIRSRDFTAAVGIAFVPRSQSGGTRTKDDAIA